MPGMAFSLSNSRTFYPYQLYYRVHINFPNLVVAWVCKFKFFYCKEKELSSKKVEFLHNNLDIFEMECVLPGVWC